jgi:peroxiredoxin Q/BCP
MFQVLDGLSYAFPRTMRRLAPGLKRLEGLRERVRRQPRIAAYLASAATAALQRGRRVPQLPGAGAAAFAPGVTRDVATKRPFAHLGATMIQAGQQAPPFTLQDSTGKAWSLDALRASGPVVLFFYPRDESPICTREVCSFRDAHQDFVDAGATVVGVSSDSQESHAAFAKKRALPYVLLSDRRGRCERRSGSQDLRAGRRPGDIRHRPGGVVRLAHSAALEAEGHMEQALTVVRQLLAA